MSWDSHTPNVITPEDQKKIDVHQAQSEALDKAFGNLFKEPVVVRTGEQQAFIKEAPKPLSKPTWKERLGSIFGKK